MTAVGELHDDTARTVRVRGYWTAVTTFVGLAFVLSWWPAIGRLDDPDAALVLPIGPSLAALVLVGWYAVPGGRRRLLRSTVDGRPLRQWWPALLIPPAIGAVAVALHLASGGTTPGTGDVGSSALLFVVLPLTAVVGGPLGEELGWRGFLLPLLMQRFSAITATFVLLPIWLAFHLPLTIADPDRYGALWALNLTGIAVTMTWLHVRTGASVLFAVVFHAVANTSTGAAVTMFPENERMVPWAIATGLWLLVACFAVMGPLSQRASTTRAPIAAPTLPARFPNPRQ